MVLKGIKRRAAWLKDYLRGRLGLRSSGAEPRGGVLSQPTPFATLRLAGNKILETTEYDR